jgi:hypothetical protein
LAARRAFRGGPVATIVNGEFVWKRQDGLARRELSLKLFF